MMMHTAAAHLPESRVGTTVAGFRIAERFAVGKHATVYRATDGTRTVALKIYEAKPHLPVDGTARAGLESDAQAQIDHPAVARRLDAKLLPDGSYCLVSQWIEGVPLTTVVDERPSWPRVRPLIEAINAGLGAIHAAGIVHRDLKPSNVILPSRPGPAAVIVDFSHSLVLGGVRITPTTMVLGSAAYMSPEQAAGLPLDGRSDLYALGVIVYQLLTGVLPFEGGTETEVMRRHQLEQVISPRRRAPERDIPQVAEDLCMWLLTKSRDARLPNSRVLAVTLGALASDHGALAGVTIAVEGS